MDAKTKADRLEGDCNCEKFAGTTNGMSGSMGKGIPTMAQASSVGVSTGKGK